MILCVTTIIWVVTYFFMFIDDSDFRVISYKDNGTKIDVMAHKDNVSLEYDDTVILTFTPDDPDLISSLETAGEYIRDTATINIIDNDRKAIIQITYLTLLSPHAGFNLHFKNAILSYN